MCKEAIVELSEHIKTYGAGGNIQFIIQPPPEEEMGEEEEEEEGGEESEMSDGAQSCPF